MIVAAGESRRMGSLDKILTPVLGRPLLCHTVDPFQSHPSVDEIVIVTSQQKAGTVRTLAREWKWDKVAEVCIGGARRQDSVLSGLNALSNCEWVLVHDGARPCVDMYIIDRALEAVCSAQAAIAAMPVKDTVKMVSTEGLVLETPDRSSLWAVQTPQAFCLSLLRRAHEQHEDDVTDDAAMLEALGHEVTVFEGSYENVKVTTPEDLLVVEAILRRRRERKI